ncbi:MAG: hypothetical protein RJA76_1122 [Bacteroidota bacterium]|jgi:hypothetical protein
MKGTLLISILLVFGLLCACSKSSVEPVAPTPIPNNQVLGSFDLIQEKIFTPTCATSGCHLNNTDASFSQHELLLSSASVSYKNLVEMAPKNATAIANKLKRVTKFVSDGSMLFHKLNWDVSHHSSINYGSPMPLGGKPLSVGQLDFVKKWIDAGAPEKGTVVDAKLLDDTTPHYDPTSAFIPLDSPEKEGKSGIQLKIEKFTVAPNFEREIFVRRPLNNAEAIYINRIKLKSRSNSHHLVLYDFKDKSLLPNLNDVRDLRNSDGSFNLLTYLTLANHIFLGGGTDPNSDYIFPEGTALMLPANSSIDVNPHYFNRTAEPLYGENYVNLYTVKPDQVKNVVKMIDFNNTSFLLPAGKKTTITSNFNFAKDKAVSVVSLTSHFHELGKLFQIKIRGGKRDGEVIYESTDWQHPKVINFAQPIELEANVGLSSVVTYDNNTSKDIKFGFTSQDEMNIIFGYYFER